MGIWSGSLVLSICSAPGWCDNHLLREFLGEDHEKMKSFNILSINPRWHRICLPMQEVWV